MKFLDALERIALAICMFIIVCGFMYFASTMGGNKEYNANACLASTGNVECK